MRRHNANEGAADAVFQKTKPVSAVLEDRCIVVGVEYMYGDIGHGNTWRCTLVGRRDRQHVEVAPLAVELSGNVEFTVGKDAEHVRLVS